MSREKKKETTSEEGPFPKKPSREARCRRTVQKNGAGPPPEWGQAGGGAQALASCEKEKKETFRGSHRANASQTNALSMRKNRGESSSIGATKKLSRRGGNGGEEGGNHEKGDRPIKSQTFPKCEK